MDLTFYNHMTKAVRDNKRIKQFGWQINFYRHFEDVWHVDSTTIQKTDPKVGLLTQVKTTNQLIQKGGKGYFYIETLDAAIEMQPPTLKQKRTFNLFVDELNDALTNADHHFNANHDNLTRLLNRNGFEAAIKKVTIRAPKTILASDPDAPYSNLSIAVITLDIDHFKQINDSYLHDYGDIVLKTFAWRVAEFAKLLPKKYNVKALFGRVGGEEFDLFLYEIQNGEIIDEIAENLRKHIEGEPIPSNQQAALLKLDESTIPSEQESGLHPLQ